MKKSIKGAVFSGLVFPGLGQVVLKRYRRGFILMFVTLASIMAIAIKIVQLALTILENIGMNGTDVDVQAITQEASRVISASDSTLYQLCMLVIIACWIFGTIDAYRIGKEMDRTF